jgi:hypothetical protein
MRRKKMKNLMLVFVVAFAFCPVAMASDIAISTQAGWFSQSAADREMQEIVDNVTAVSVELFSVNEQDALADWVADHTGDGASDLLILCGQFPDTIYAPGNAQADDSLAELFLDDGNCIVNTGDYMFYVVNGAGTNDAPGLQTMMDIAGITMWDDDTAVVVTAEGRDITPTLVDYATDRPFHLDELEGDWYAELILAQNDAGTRADPVIVTNSATGGRLGIFYQTAGQDDDPRGEVISEWINNWFLKEVASGTPLARRPDPKDGAMHADTWITLAWTPGDFAVSHDVYFGENFDDVNDATNESDTFQGNQPSTFFIAGFPGFAYPDGLVPGTTYYWRIDEVNEAHPNSPWKSKVWSFMVPPKMAYNPVPADGARFVDPDGQLSWTAGFGAKLHTVYFGDNFDDVNNAAGGLPQGITTYTPAALELEKTYYWRVDEFDAVTTHKGDVWSFTIAKEGGGIKGEYFNNMDLAGIPVLTRIDPQINFNWGDPGSPDASVPVDLFSARWTGEVEAEYTETYTFYTNSDDGVRLWVDGQQLVDNWTDHGTTENRGTIDLVAGNTYSLVMEFYENGGGAVAELRWSSPSTPKQHIPQAALSPPVKASSPNPSSGAVDVKQTAILKWSAGEAAASHQVYFGTDGEAVRNANTSSPEYKGTRTLGSESYDPGKLEWDTAYYWRVDEIEDDGTIQTGNLWSFTTANFLIVDDFEDYDVGNNEIWWSWKDGLGYGAHDNEPAYAGNGTGSAVGDENTPSYTEETIVHGGNQSMPLFYDNNKQGFFKYSEAELTLTYPRDWTENGVNRLTIWFRGDSANAVETLYVALNGSAVVNNDNPNAALITDWADWNIDLQAFADQGVGLTNVNTIALGLGNKMNPLAGGSGTMYFDDVRLYPPAP